MSYRARPYHIPPGPLPSQRARKHVLPGKALRSAALEKGTHASIPDKLRLLHRRHHSAAVKMPTAKGAGCSGGKVMVARSMSVFFHANRGYSTFPRNEFCFHLVTVAVCQRLSMPLLHSLSPFFRLALATSPPPPPPCFFSHPPPPLPLTARLPELEDLAANLEGDSCHGTQSVNGTNLGPQARPRPTPLSMNLTIGARRCPMPATLSLLAQT